MSGETENLSGNVGDAGIQFPPAKRNRKGRSGRKQKSTIDEGSHQEVMSPHSKSTRGTKAGSRHAILFALDQTELEDEQSSPSDGNTASPFSTSDNFTQDTEFEGQGRYLKSTISLDDSNGVKLERSALLAFPGHVDFQELVEQQRKNEQERPEQVGKYSSGMANTAWARTRMTDADDEVSTPSERSEHVQQHSSLDGTAIEKVNKEICGFILSPSVRQASDQAQLGSFPHREGKDGNVTSEYLDPPLSALATRFIQS